MYEDSPTHIPKIIQNCIFAHLCGEFLGKNENLPTGEKPEYPPNVLVLDAEYMNSTKALVYNNVFKPNQIIVPNPDPMVLEKAKEINVGTNRVNTYLGQAADFINSSAHTEFIRRMRAIWFDTDKTYWKTQASSTRPAHNYKEDISLLLTQMYIGCKEGEHVIFASNFAVRCNTGKTVNNLVNSLEKTFKKTGFIFKSIDLKIKIQRMCKNQKYLNNDYHANFAQANTDYFKIRGIEFDGSYPGADLNKGCPMFFSVYHLQKPIGRMPPLRYMPIDKSIDLFIDKSIDKSINKSVICSLSPAPIIKLPYYQIKNSTNRCKKFECNIQSDIVKLVKSLHKNGVSRVDFKKKTNH